MVAVAIALRDALRVLFPVSVAVVSAAGAGDGQLTQKVSLPRASSSGPSGGQAPEIFLVLISVGAYTFRKQANSVGILYTERFAYNILF